MIIKCTTQEFKELINKEHAECQSECSKKIIKLDGKEIISSLEKCQNSQIAKCYKPLNSQS